MTELDRYTNGAPIEISGGTPLPALPPATDTDGWIRVVADVARLAQQIASTDFVPDAMRGKPAAVTAAILAGREMGVGPMTALQHIHVIKGKPGQSAHLMRGLVLAAGHEVDYVETTDSRAVIRGRRRGETDWTTVEFTADQARRAKIDLGGYPSDKLVARATARLCRRKFADVISGLAYSVEELQDGDAQLIEAGESPAAIAAGEADPSVPVRTAQRKPAQRRRSTAADSTAAAPSAPGKPPPSGGADGPSAAAAPTPPTGPPLPGEDGYDESASRPVEDRQPADEDEPPPGEPLDPNGESTVKHNRMMHALFRQADLGGDDNRARRLLLTGLILGRELGTSAGLTVADAKVVIDALLQLKSSDDFPRAVDAYVRAHQQREAEIDAAADESQAAEQHAADDPEHDAENGA